MVQDDQGAAVFAVGADGVLRIGTGTITFDGTNIPNLIRSNNSLTVAAGGFGALTLDSGDGSVALATGDLLSFEGSTSNEFETT